MSKMYLDIENDQEVIRYIKYYMFFQTVLPDSEWNKDDLDCAFVDETIGKFEDLSMFNNMDELFDDISFIIDDVLEIAKNEDRCNEIKEKAAKAILKFKTS